MTVAAWICLAAPLGGALTITLCGTTISRRTAGYLSTGSVFASFVAAVVVFAKLLGESPDERQHASTAWSWLTAGSFDVGLRILTDPLSVFMMLVVSGVGFLIVAYSIGYMDGDDEERRYFAYMALFVFSMLLLVQGGNFLMLLAGWGLVGLSSYLLIGFWHERPTAIAAAKKAFVMNAVGDATMALAFFLLIQRGHSLTFPQAFDVHGGSWFVNLVALWGESPHERSHASTIWTWLDSGSFSVGLRILVDPLSVLMMLIVSGVGALIVGYSIGYMDSDDEERR